MTVAPTHQGGAPANPSRETGSPNATKRDVPEDAFKSGLLIDVRDTLRTFSFAAPTWVQGKMWLAFLSDRQGTWQGYLSRWDHLELPPQPICREFTARQTDLTVTRSGVFLSHENTKAPLLYHNLNVDGCHPVPLPDASAPQQLFALPSALDQVFLRSQTALFFSDGTRPPIKSPVQLVTTHEVLATTPDGSHVAVKSAPGQLQVIPSNLAAISTATLPTGVELKTARFLSARQLLIGAREAATCSIWLYDRPKAALSQLHSFPDGRCELQLATSTSGSSIALMLQNDGATQLFYGHIRNNKALELKRAELTEGDGRLGQFTRDGRFVTFTWATIAHPASMFELDTLLGKTKALRDDVRPTLARLRDIGVTRHTIDSQGVYVFGPAGSSERAPVVLNWDRERSPQLGWRPELRLLVGRGVYVVEPSWTGAQTTPAFETALMKWIETQPWAGDSGTIIASTDRASLTRSASRWRTFSRTAPTSSLPSVDHNAFNSLADLAYFVLAPSTSRRKTP